MQVPIFLVVFVVALLIVKCVFFLQLSKKDFRPLTPEQQQKRDKQEKFWFIIEFSAYAIVAIGYVVEWFSS